jgi:rhodanese-related sulfurtransferase
VSITPQTRTAGPDYAGDIDVTEAWGLLKSDPQARLLDVRSAAEWSFIGVPDLRPAGKAAIFVELQSFPGMAANPQFLTQAVAALEKSGARQDGPVLCICRSGGRSRTAAIALTRAGFTRCYNVAGGMEGDLDADEHRGRLNGWKAAGLPWRQT